MNTLINDVLGALLFLSLAVLFGVSFAIVSSLLTRKKNVGRVR